MINFSYEFNFSNRKEVNTNYNTQYIWYNVTELYRIVIIILIYNIMYKNLYCKTSTLPSGKMLIFIMCIITLYLHKHDLRITYYT